MCKKLSFVLAFVLFSNPCFSKTESGNSDAAPSVLYGKYNGTLVPLKTDSAGIVQISGSASGNVGAGIAGYLARYSGTGTTLAGSTAIYDDNAGNIGIGTASPAYTLDVAGTIHTTGTNGIVLANGAGVKTGTTAANTALIQGYNTGGASYTTLLTATAGATPTLDLISTATIGAVQIVSTTVAQTLTNKIITAPIIATILSNAGAATLTLPTSTATLATLALAETFTNKTLTSPKIGTSILDTNGAILFGITATVSAVNYLAYANGATGTDPTWTVTGDANRGVTITCAGTGGQTIVSTNTGPSTIKRGLTVNNDSNSGAGDDFTVKTTGSATGLVVSAANNTITSGFTGAIGWTPVAGANTACNTTCTSACVFGIDTGSTTNSMLACTDATADVCLCAGAS